MQSANNSIVVKVPVERGADDIEPGAMLVVGEDGMVRPARRGEANGLVGFATDYSDDGTVRVHDEELRPASSRD